MSGAELLRVRDVSEFVTKGTTPTTIGRPFTTSGVKFLKVETFSADGTFLPGREAYVDIATHQLLRRSQLAEGDILFSIAGALGRSTVVDQCWLPANTNQAFAIIRPSPRRRSVLPRYLLWYLRSPAVSRRIAEINVQAAQANLSLEQVRDFEIPVVSLDEQQAVVDALDSVDSLVIGIERLLSKRQAIRQGMLQQLLTGRLRLSTFSDKWQEVKLSEIGSILIGLTYSPVSVKRCGTLVLRSSNIQEGQLDLRDSVFVDCPVPSEIRIKENDILICVRNGSRSLIGKSLMLDDRVVGETFGAFMAVFRSPVNPYLQFFFQTNEFKRQIDEHLGATINQITNGSLNQFIVDLPGAEEQHAITHLLAVQDELIGGLIRKLEKAKMIKQAMMQELLANPNRIRVGDGAA